MKITTAQMLNILAHEIHGAIYSANSCASRVELAISQKENPARALQDLRGSLELIRMVNERVRCFAYADDSARTLTGLTRGAAFRGILKDVVVILQKQARLKELQIIINQYDLSGDVVFPLDADLLKQIAFNLVDNAVKYSFRDTQVVIACFMERDGSSAVLRVIDSGIQLTNDEEKRCGEAFWRAPQAAGTHVNGAGLGLYVVCKILGSVGGHFRIQAQDGVTVAEAHIPLQKGC